MDIKVVRDLLVLVDLDGNVVDVAETGASHTLR
jgi:hypothetical protein